jgi:predicted RNA-binding Zn-ribbon protein involved in translation (DUF1610 family)
MIKFQCGHCGHRIAIARRHLGKLVGCPECGQVTHPLDEHLVKGRAKPPAASHCCANCGQMIGKLQKLHLWENKIVCGACQKKLTAEAAPAPIPVVATVAPRAVARHQPASIAHADADLNALARPFRGGLFGAMVGLCVAGAAMYGALSLLKEVAGLIMGLAFGGLALVGIYLGVRIALASRNAETSSPSVRQPRLIEK